MYLPRFPAHIAHQHHLGYITGCIAVCLFVFMTCHQCWDSSSVSSFLCTYCDFIYTGMQRKTSKDLLNSNVES